MHFDTDGIYTLQYTAEDSCGNETVEERTVEVISYKTVLFTDGTFIINEKGSDRAANVALHGAVTNEYIPFNPNGSTNVEKYIFATFTERPWHAQRLSVRSVEIGSPISPPSTAYWFHVFTGCVSMNLDNLDTSATTNMDYMFYACRGFTTFDFSNFDTSAAQSMACMFATCRILTTLDLSNFDTSAVTNMTSMFFECFALTTLNLSSFDTSKVTDMGGMFEGCSALVTLDLSNFDTSAVTNTQNMFQDCSALTTIYASTDFVVTQVTNSVSMFARSGNIVGGAGTTYNPSYIDKTYARIDNPPDASGYFTAKS